MWRHCNETDILSLCHTNDLLSHWYEPFYLHIIHPYGLTRLYIFQYNDVIWTPSRLKSPATPLFVNVLLLLNNKWKSQSSTYCPFLRGIHWWFSPQRAGVSMSWRHYKNIERHTAHIIVSWSNPKQSILFYTFVIPMKYTNYIIIYFRD